MVKIRLTRGGAKKRPHYRIVAIDERLQRDGRPLEFLGTYDPASKPEKFDIKVDRFDAWIAIRPRHEWAQLARDRLNLGAR